MSDDYSSNHVGGSSEDIDVGSFNFDIEDVSIYPVSSLLLVLNNFQNYNLLVR